MTAPLRRTQYRCRWSRCCSRAARSAEGVKGCGAPLAGLGAAPQGLGSRAKPCKRSNMKLDRLIGILSILMQREKVTAPYLAETFEVSRRTIGRDIETLCRAGVPIETRQGPGGGLSIMRGYRVDRSLLTSKDMEDILAGLRSLDSVSGSNRYAQLMEKLDGLMAGEGPLLIDLASWYKRPLSEKLGLLQRAVGDKRLISFRYYAPGGESERVIEPYYILFRWGSWYVWGFCQMREDYRLFKLGRMTELSLGGSFEPREAPYPDLSDERVFPGNYHVEAIVPGGYKWKLVESYGERCFTVEPDGRCRFKIDFTNLDSAVGWLLEFRGDAELIGPPELREELLRMGRKILDRYG